MRISNVRFARLLSWSSLRPKQAIKIAMASALSLAAVMSPAAADPITRTVNFTASGFAPEGGGVSPYSTVTGSFTVSLDTALSYNNATIGLTNLSLSAPFAPAGFYYNSATDIFVLGGLVNGVTSWGSPNGDFILRINSFATETVTPSFMEYVAANNFHRAAALQVSASPLSSPVPEPETWALVISGFGALGASFRRRRTLLVVSP